MNNDGKEENLMKKSLDYIIPGLVILAVILLSLMRSPEAIAEMLSKVSSELTVFSVLTHVLFLIVIATGLLVKKYRNVVFFSFIAFLSLSAMVISINYMVLTNIIAFTTILVLIIFAWHNRELNFEFDEITSANKIFGVLALVFGFWYLHWVESPVWLNALLYSPLGSVNCPTLLTICGFLCLTAKPRSVMLDLVVALFTLYFAVYGILFLGAWVDIVLVICALFLLCRVAFSETHNNVFDKTQG
jgi:hypothetical protein